MSVHTSNENIADLLIATVPVRDMDERNPSCTQHAKGATASLPNELTTPLRAGNTMNCGAFTSLISTYIQSSK